VNWLQSRKRWILAAAAVSAFAAGLPMAFAPELGKNAFWSTQVVFLVIDLFLLFAWVQLDRRELGVPRSAGFNFALVWFAAIAVPVHFARTRPAGRRWLPIVVFLLAITVGYQVLAMAGAIFGVIVRALFLGVPPA
jgi:hypothetical protein